MPTTLIKKCSMIEWEEPKAFMVDYQLVRMKQKGCEWKFENEKRQVEGSFARQKGSKPRSKRWIVPSWPYNVSYTYIHGSRIARNFCITGKNKVVQFTLGLVILIRCCRILLYESFHYDSPGHGHETRFSLISYGLAEKRLFPTHKLPNTLLELLQRCSSKLSTYAWKHDGKWFSNLYRGQIAPEVEKYENDKCPQADGKFLSANYYFMAEKQFLIHQGASISM